MIPPPFSKATNLVKLGSWFLKILTQDLHSLLESKQIANQLSGIFSCHLFPAKGSPTGIPQYNWRQRLGIWGWKWSGWDGWWAETESKWPYLRVKYLIHPTFDLAFQEDDFLYFFHNRFQLVLDSLPRNKGRPRYVEGNESTLQPMISAK